MTLICVGRLKEGFYKSACAEYIKRLSGYTAIKVIEISEAPLPERASAVLTDAAMKREAEAIIAKIPSGAEVAALCVEGLVLTSEELAGGIREAMLSGRSALCFIIGGSVGLHESVKSLAHRRISLSRMTFPHHLARVVLLEQLYRAFSIISGGKYHK